jgi:hypothetical protein
MQHFLDDPPPRNSKPYRRRYRDKDQGIQLCFSNPGVQEVMERFQTSGLAAEVGEENIFVMMMMHDAMTWCSHELNTAAVSQEHAGIEIQLSVQWTQTNRLVTWTMILRNKTMQNDQERQNEILWL